MKKIKVIKDVYYDFSGNEEGIQFKITDWIESNSNINILQISSCQSILDKKIYSICYILYDDMNTNILHS